MSETCRRCDSEYALPEDHTPTAHGLCWGCASAELDEVLAVLEEAGVDVSRLDSVTVGVKRLVQDRDAARGSA